MFEQYVIIPCMKNVLQKTGLTEEDLPPLELWETSQEPDMKPRGRHRRLYLPSPLLTKEGEKTKPPLCQGTWEIEPVAGVTVRPYDLPFVRRGKVPMRGRSLLNGPSLLPFVRGGKEG